MAAFALQLGTATKNACELLIFRTDDLALLKMPRFDWLKKDILEDYTAILLTTEFCELIKIVKFFLIKMINWP